MVEREVTKLLLRFFVQNYPDDGLLYKNNKHWKKVG